MMQVETLAMLALVLIQMYIWMMVDNMYRPSQISDS